MKTRIIALFAGLLAVLPMTSAWAGATYYKVALTAKMGTGCGKIYASEGMSNSPQYQATDMSVDGNGTEKSTVHTFYVYAQHKYGYKFSSWSGPDVSDTQSSAKGSASCADDQKLIENGCKVTVTSGSYDFGQNDGTQTTTATITANYIACTADDEAGTVTFVSNSGVLSYSATSPVGFPEVPAGGTKPFYKNDVDTTWKITAKGQDGYKLTGWKVSKNGVASTPSGDTLSLSIDATSSPILVEAIFEQVSYQIGDVFKKTFDEALEYANANSIKAITLVANSTYDGDLTIPSGLTLTVGAGLTLAVNGSLTVAGTLSNKGTVAPTGAMSVSGTLTNNSGSTLTIAAGQKCELATSAKVTNNGAINGSGQLVMGTIAITQDATVTKCGYDLDGNSYTDVNGHGSFGIKYHKDTRVQTSAGTFSGSNPTGTKAVWKMSINGGDEVLYETTGASLGCLVCTVDATTAINHITGLANIYASAKDAIGDITSGSTSKMAVLLSDSTCSYSGNWQKSVIIDCAGYTFSLSSGSQVNASAIVTCLNSGESASINKVTNACGRFINCKKASISTLHPGSGASSSSRMLLYDCVKFSPGLSGTAEIMSSGNPCGGVYIFGGGPFDNVGFTKNYYIYGGTFKTKYPTDDNCKIAEGLAVFGPDASGVYTVGEAVVAKKIRVLIGDTVIEKPTLAEAVQAGGNNSAVIKLAESIVLDEPVEVAAGQNLVISLEGYAIEANKGAFVNYGNLTIDGSAAGQCKISATGTNPSPILTNRGGEIHLAYGTYSGDIRLEGGKLFTHIGTFDTTLTIANSSCGSPTDLAAVRGGTFANMQFSFNGEMRDLLELCPDGYYSQSAGGTPERFRMLKDLDVTISGSRNTKVGGHTCDAAFSFMLMTDADRANYLLPLEREQHASLESWYHRLDLEATVGFVAGTHKIDCTISFDRTVSNGWISAYGAVAAFQNLADGGELDRTLQARSNNTWRVNIDNVQQGHVKGAYEDYYFYYVLDENGAIRGFDRFIDECGGGATFGALANNDAVIGTTCYIDMIICNRRSQSDMLTYVDPIAMRQFVFGAGSNVAMIRPATGAATFYPTLKAAFGAAKNGETVMLCNDCPTCEPIAAECSFKFDANGFKFDGEIAAEDGYTMSVENGVYTFKKFVIELPQNTGTTGGGEPKPAVSIVPDVDLIKEAKEEAGPNATQEEIAKKVQEMLEKTEENGLKVWENKLVEQATPEQKADKVVVQVVEKTVGEQKVIETRQVAVETKNGYDKLEAGIYREAFAVKDDAGNEVKIADTNPEVKSISVVKNTSAEKTIILPVPGEKNEKSEGVSIDNVIAPGSLNKGDIVTYYDGDTKLEWKFLGGEGEDRWEVRTTNNKDGVDKSKKADECTLLAGEAFWLTRANTEKPVVIVAEKPTMIEKPVTAGEWNLEANPDPVSEKNLDDVVKNPATGDQIVIPTAKGAQKKATLDKEGKWTYKHTYVDEDGFIVSKRVPAKVEGGQGFWYISESADKETKIKW